MISHPLSCLCWAFLRCRYSHMSESEVLLLSYPTAPSTLLSLMSQVKDFQVKDAWGRKCCRASMIPRLRPLVAVRIELRGIPSPIPYQFLQEAVSKFCDLEAWHRVENLCFVHCVGEGSCNSKSQDILTDTCSSQQEEPEHPKCFFSRKLSTLSWPACPTTGWEAENSCLECSWKKQVLCSKPYV